MDGKYVGTSGVALIKLCQRAEHQKAIFTDVAPALLTATLLWDLRREVLVGPTSHWLIQGFPHPCVPSLAEFSRAFPCKADLVRVEVGLSGAIQKQLVGNSMHLAAVGAWTLHCLLCMDTSAMQRQ